MARRRFQNGWIIKRCKNWVLRYREDVRGPDGKIERIQRSVILGKFSGKREARNEAAKRLRDFNSGTRRPQSSMTFSDFWNGYFNPEVISKRKISTQQMYRYLGQKHLLPFFGQRRLCDLERAEVQDFINMKQRGGYAPETLRHLRNLLGKAFGTAISRDCMVGNPARNLELPRMERRRLARVLTLQEIADLLKAFDAQLRAIILLGLLPLPVLQFLLGHTSMETTMIYTHPLAEAQRVAVEQMASILLPNTPKSTK